MEGADKSTELWQPPCSSAVAVELNCHVRLRCIKKVVTAPDFRRDICCTEFFSFSPLLVWTRNVLHLLHRYYTVLNLFTLYLPIYVVPTYEYCTYLYTLYLPMYIVSTNEHCIYQWALYLPMSIVPTNEHCTYLCTNNYIPKLTTFDLKYRIGQFKLDDYKRFSSSKRAA